MRKGYLHIVKRNKQTSSFVGLRYIIWYRIGVHVKRASKDAEKLPYFRKLFITGSPQLFMMAKISLINMSFNAWNLCKFIIWMYNIYYEILWVFFYFYLLILLLWPKLFIQPMSSQNIMSKALLWFSNQVFYTILFPNTLSPLPVPFFVHAHYALEVWVKLV